MKRRSPWLALLAGIGLALALTSSVSAYVGQVPTFITLNPFRATVPCGHYYSVVATVLDQNGKPIKHLTVNFAITSSPSSHDKLKPTTKQTNKHGQAKVFIKYACKVGNRTITATVDGLSASTVVYVKLRSHHHHDDDEDNDHHDGDSDKKLSAGAVLGIDAVSLPNTSTSPAVASTASTPAPTIPAVIALLAAVAIILRRFALSRR
jgi:hypothetical protein